MENLKLKSSDYQRELSFNEWVEKYNVSSGHQVKTEYYQGNPSSGIKPIGVAKYLDETTFERLLRVIFNKINKF